MSLLFPSLFPPSLPLIGLHTAPSTSPTPLEVDELIHQQERASQVGDVGLWTATVAVWLTTWNVPEEKQREKKTEMGMEEPREEQKNV